MQVGEGTFDIFRNMKTNNHAEGWTPPAAEVRTRAILRAHALITARH